MKDVAVVKDYYLRRIRKLKELLANFTNATIIRTTEGQGFKRDYLTIVVPKDVFEEAKKLLGGGGS